MAVLFFVVVGRGSVGPLHHGAQQFRMNSALGEGGLIPDLLVFGFLLVKPYFPVKHSVSPFAFTDQTFGRGGVSIRKEKFLKEFSRGTAD